MATSHRFGRSLAQQAFALRAHFPRGELSLARGALTWSGHLQPTALSRTYAVRIRYRLGEHPTTAVDRPALRTRREQGLPHVYTGDLLCLYEDVDWAPTMSLARTIVPWTAEWLMYYEIWLVTGTWEGGGQWPPLGSSDSPQAADYQRGRKHAAIA